VIVVTVNYRIGYLGFFAHPELTAESSNNASGNYGLLDVIAALKWVQRNIRQFGGDPSRVTIGGQSADASIVHVLTTSPLAKGLFVNAIAESGCRLQTDSVETLPEAENVGAEMARELGANYWPTFAICLPATSFPATLRNCRKERDFTLSITSTGGASQLMKRASTPWAVSFRSTGSRDFSRMKPAPLKLMES